MYKIFNRDLPSRTSVFSPLLLSAHITFIHLTNFGLLDLNTSTVTSTHFSAVALSDNLCLMNFFNRASSRPPAKSQRSSFFFFFYLSCICPSLNSHLCHASLHSNRMFWRLIGTYLLATEAPLFRLLIVRYALKYDDF